MDSGLIVDVETTGLDSEKDKIIELGIVEFTVDGSFDSSISRIYGGLEDPQVPLSAEIENLTGIKSTQLSGAKIDWDFVRELFAKSSVVIAHNMAFDRGFLQKRPELSGLSPHWACSLQHIDWNRHGFSSKKLNYLAADHGFINPFAHRAVFDCATTFRLVQPHLEELLTKSYERVFLVKAFGAPFESRHELKKRGYHWDPEERVWQNQVFETDLDNEKEFLSETVYQQLENTSELNPVDIG